VKLNFRELGTGYCPVLLSFGLLLLLGGLALHSGVPLSKQAVSGGNQSTLEAFAAPDLAANHPAVSVDLGQLPLGFEPNQGQTDPQVKFLARGAGYGVFLTADQAILTLRSPAKSSAVVHMQLAGANPAATATGTSQLPGKSNYFIGNDSAKWHSGVSQFARVRYESVYPGVDLVYYGNQGQLEYDFEVAPGADPSQIGFRFHGQESANLNLDDSGDLILAAGGNKVRLKAPRIYQEFGTERRPVAGHFVLQQDGRVGFELAAYDRRRTLVIDPELTYSTYFGGSLAESCSAILGVVSPPSGCPAIAIDPSSNIYIAGSTTSPDFPVVPPVATPPSAFQPAIAAAPDVFVTKLNATGSAVLFSTYLGGDNVDTTAGVAVDTAFDVVVAGTTASSNFPVSTSSAFQAAPTNTNRHAFVSVLSSTGENLLYSTYLSGNGAESARGVALDPRNKIYVIGTTTSKDQPDATHSFPATLGAIQVASLGNSQFFVSKIDPTLIGFPSLVYSTYFGGGNPIDGLTLGGGIAVDANSNVYITGGTNFQHTGSTATDFPILNAFQGCLDTPSTTTTTTTNCVTPASPIPTDAFVAKLNPAAAAGAQLLYSTYLGGTGNDAGFGIAVDSGLSAYITGSTSSTDVTIPSGTTPLQRCLNNPTNPSPCPAGVTASDAFVGKFGTPCTGSTCTTTAVPFTYFSYLGGSGDDVGLSIAVDTLQGARIAGWTSSTNFPTPNNNNVQPATGGGVDAFASRIDTTASSTVALGHYGTYLGGAANDFGTGITVDAQGSSYIVGETASGNFPKANPIQANINGTSDAFVTKLGPALSLTVTEAVTPLTVGVGNNATFTYTITNNGDLTTGIIFTDVLPSTATFVSANASPGQSNCPAPTNSIVTCTVGTLNGGAIGTVTVVLAPTLPALPLQPGSVSDGGKVSIFGTSKVFTPAAPAVAAVNNFGVGVSPTTATVAAGIPASFTVTVTPTGNIPNTVTLSASGAPTGGTTSFPNGTSFTNLSSGAQSRQLVVNTTARVTTPASLFPVSGPFYAAFLPVSGLALLGAGIGGGKKSRRRRALMAVLLGCFFALVMFQIACGSKSTTTTTTGTPAGTYNLTVTATSAAASRTQQIVLVVQ
jgi:hypothetical protein